MMQELVNNETRNFIEKVLKKRAIENYSIDVAPGSVRGDNYLGVIAKVVVTGEDENGKSTTLNFIVKTAPKSEVFRSLAPIQLIYTREIYMYSKVFPIFEKLQEERGILKPFKSLAKYYDSTLNTSNETLIMENMKELGYALCNRHEPLDYNHVMLVMREYGKFHALSYALRDQEPEVFEEFANNTRDVFFGHSKAGRLSVKENSERALRSLDPIKDEVAYNKFKKFQETMLDVVLEVVKPEPAGKYSVLNHGDCWTNNILFKYKNSNSNVPSELCFLDWQLSRIASPVLDLSYFIFTCTDKSLRDQHYNDMIQEYYNSLKSFLSELGSDPEELFPFEILQEHLKKFSVFGLYMSTLILHLMTSEVNEIPDFQNAGKAKEVTDKLGFRSRNEEKYREKIRAVILDFVKLGYEF